MNKAQAIKSVEERIVDISEADPYLKVLAYGRNGKGKTRFAARAPAPIIIDINEKGTKSARTFPNVKVFHARTWEDISWAYWYLRAGKHPYKTVVLDTLTQMQSMCQRHVLREAEDRDPNKDPAMMTMREWGKTAELMKPLLLNFRNLPMHVVFLAQERTVDNEENETTERVPDLSPGSRVTATASVDIIGRMYTKEVRVADKETKKEIRKWETRMIVGPHEEYTTKDRTGALGRIVREPTMFKLLEAARLEED